MGSKKIRRGPTPSEIRQYFDTLRKRGIAETIWDSVGGPGLPGERPSPYAWPGAIAPRPPAGAQTPPPGGSSLLGDPGATQPVIKEMRILPSRGKFTCNSFLDIQKVKGNVALRLRTVYFAPASNKYVQQWVRQQLLDSIERHRPDRVLLSLRLPVVTVGMLMRYVTNTLGIPVSVFLDQERE
jgi:hypothetical protein